MAKGVPAKGDVKSTPELKQDIEAADEGDDDMRRIGVHISAKSRPAFDDYCDIDFYYKGKLAYSESLYDGEDEVSRYSLKKYNNKIDRIDYDCSSRCKIVLYAGEKLSEHNIGFWTSNDSYSIYLNEYVSYDQINDEWDQWDRVTSSYYISCPNF